MVVSFAGVARHRLRRNHQTDFDDWTWTPVATYSDPLDAQRLPDRQTIMWYRVAIDLPSPLRKPALFFREVDGDARVWGNGQEVGASEKKRTPFTVDAGAAWKRGRNVIAVRVDHSSITDLFLGGILRPVVLIERDTVGRAQTYRIQNWPVRLLDTAERLKGQF